ncbi:response regulator transcription factor [Caldimonas sp.]|uniref:response regulator transcription factor n=1 Tax=Caldimonas sp. TaxID=2838790 RepID=UPI00307D176B
MRLLLIEDDRLLGGGLRDYLGALGHAVDWVTEVAQAEVLASEPYDAWLIDWQLPDGSGLDWLRRRRRQGDATAALVLTARDRVHERIEGLDSGADDYLVKPFDPEELLARLRAVQRRAQGGAGQPLRWGTLCIDLGRRQVRRDEQPVELTAREWAVLEALILRAGRLVPKAELEALVFAREAEVHSNALEVHVSHLRRKLGPGLIDTVRGLGYRLRPSEAAE